jgi:SAM-dependent methyltransferase
MLTHDLLAFVRGSLPPPPSRVLEIGAGRGDLAGALGAAGYGLTAIDPEAEPGSHVQRCSLLDVRGRFDAAVAVVAMHHVDPLNESCAHLATLIGPGALLVIDELDIDRYDERAAAWWLGQRQALGLDTKDHDPASMLESARRHIHPWTSIAAALAPYFALGVPVPGPYLHRWELRPSLREAEVDLISEGLLPAVGIRVVAARLSN